MQLKNLFTIILIGLTSFNSSSKGSVSAYIYFEDPMLSKQELNEWADIIYLQNKKAKLADFAVYQNITISSFDDDFKADNGKSCPYRTINIDCDYDRCFNIKNLIDSKQSRNITLLVSDEQFKCENLPFDLNKERFIPTKTGIKEIIEEKLSENKKVKKDIILIFVVTSQEQIQSPTVTLENDTILVKAGESVTLSAKIENANRFLWTPSTGLSCTDCANPTITVTEEVQYTLTCSNDQCDAEPTKVTIIPENFCLDCEQTTLCVDCMGKKTYWASDHYVLIARSSGSPRFDLICESNCANRFKLELINESGYIVFSDEFDQKEVDKRANNYYHKVGFEDYFVFSINLSSVWKKIDLDKFYVKITSYNGSNETCSVYTSEDRITFRPCADE